MNKLSKENQYGLDVLGGKKLRGLDLFSGLGGLAQSVGPWVETVAYCEWNPYSQAVLLSRMERGEIDLAPIWDDVRSLEPGMLPQCDILTGGFPCQDISVAGKGVGVDGARSGLYREVLRLARVLQPRFIYFENVAAILVRGGHKVIGDLAALGYDAEWTTLSASQCGATHGRRRWWCLAHRRDVGASGLAELHAQSRQNDSSSGWDRQGRSLDDASSDGRGGSPLRQPSILGGSGSDVGLPGASTGGTGHQDVADPDSVRREDGGPIAGRLEGEGDSQSGGGNQSPVPLERSGSDGQGEGWLGDRSGQASRRFDPRAFGNPPRPPRPGDVDGWRAFLESYPEAEPVIRFDADGLRPFRRHAITALGNSVDAVASRVAFRGLLTGRFNPEW